MTDHHTILGAAMIALALTAGCATSIAPSETTAEAAVDDSEASEATPYRSMQEVLEDSTDNDWRPLDPENTLYMELKSGRVIIELATAFAPEHTANMKTLARAEFWNGLSIYRSQDNFVVQWGDPAADEENSRSLAPALEHLPAEFDRPLEGVTFTALPDSDGWSDQAGFTNGFPSATDSERVWLAHCYGAVGAGRAAEPDSSTGAELYAIIGQSPRQLDRNITLVGRVVRGMELLSILPRGPEPMGIYDSAEKYTPIISVRVASDVAETDQEPLEILRTDTQTFADLVEARRNRGGWYITPAGHIDLCNVPLPTRVSIEE